MINGNFHTEKTFAGHKIIIDIADIKSMGYPVNYEVMAMRNGGVEIESHTTNDLDEAIKYYNMLCAKYTDKPQEKPKSKPLTGKYAQLCIDLKKALAAGKAAEGDDDGGTCNLDACGVKLPRWKESLVRQAAKEAGTGVFVWDLWGSKRFVFCPNTSGQANKRSRNAEAMTAYMKNLGYDALDYSAMD